MDRIMVNVDLNISGWFSKKIKKGVTKNVHKSLCPSLIPEAIVLCMPLISNVELMMYYELRNKQNESLTATEANKVGLINTPTNLFRKCQKKQKTMKHKTSLQVYRW